MLLKKNFYYIINCQLLFMAFVSFYYNFSDTLRSFYGYESDFTLSKFIFSNLAFIILVSFCNKIKRPSDFFNQILIFFFTLPVFVYFIYNNQSFVVPFALFVFVLACLFGNSLFRKCFETLIKKIPSYRISFFFKLLVFLISLNIFFHLIFSI